MRSSTSFTFLGPLECLTRTRSPGFQERRQAGLGAREEPSGTTVTPIRRRIPKAVASTSPGIATEYSAATFVLFAIADPATFAERWSSRWERSARMPCVSSSLWLARPVSARFLSDSVAGKSRAPPLVRRRGEVAGAAERDAMPPDVLCRSRSRRRRLGLLRELGVRAK